MCFVVDDLIFSGRHSASLPCTSRALKPSSSFRMKRNLDSSGGPEEGPSLKRAYSDFGGPDRRAAEASDTSYFLLYIIRIVNK
jgi:hypothetical protein